MLGVTMDTLKFYIDSREIVPVTSTVYRIEKLLRKHSPLYRKSHQEALLIITNESHCRDYPVVRYLREALSIGKICFEKHSKYGFDEIRIVLNVVRIAKQLEINLSHSEISDSIDASKLNYSFCDKILEACLDGTDYENNGSVPPEAVPNVIKEYCKCPSENDFINMLCPSGSTCYNKYILSLTEQIRLSDDTIISIESKVDTIILLLERQNMNPIHNQNFRRMSTLANHLKNRNLSKEKAMIKIIKINRRIKHYLDNDITDYINDLIKSENLNFDAATVKATVNQMTNHNDIKVLINEHWDLFISVNMYYFKYKRYPDRLGHYSSLTQMAYCYYHRYDTNIAYGYTVGFTNCACGDKFLMYKAFYDAQPFVTTTLNMSEKVRNEFNRVLNICTGKFTKCAIKC